MRRVRGQRTAEAANLASTPVPGARSKQDKLSPVEDEQGWILGKNVV